MPGLLLRERSATARAARDNVARFVDGVVFNTVLAAPDAHARNYAVLLHADTVHLAPLFDMSTALPYSPTERGHTLSMSIDGQYVAERVTRENWLRFAETNDLDGDALVSRAQEVIETAPDAMLNALDGIDNWDGSAGKVRERLQTALAQHVPAVAANLGCS